MFPILIALFVASGAAALIYEIVWFQLLQFVIGSSAVSLAVLLTTFMGGMCLGSLLFPRIISPDRHPLRIYAAIEGGIGALAILVLLIVPIITTPYAAYVGHGFAGILVRAVVAGICLLPPTILMGATLPAISRWVAAMPGGMSSVGFFYGGNIAGGVIGCLLAGFYLMRLYDVTTATFVGVMLNAIVAAVAFVLARHPIPSPDTRAHAPAAAVDDSWTIYLVTALSGMTALAAEVIHGCCRWCWAPRSMPSRSSSPRFWSASVSAVVSVPRWRRDCPTHGSRWAYASGSSRAVVRGRRG